MRTKLAGEFARRRNGRLLEKIVNDERTFSREIKFARRGKNENGAFGNELHFFQLKRKLGFSLGIFPGGNCFAKAARMMTIEGFFDRFSHGSRAQIFSEHVRPRQRLKHGPMPTKHRDERDDQSSMTGFFQHTQSLCAHPKAVKFCKALLSTHLCVCWTGYLQLSFCSITRGHLNQK
jgi:hypothetical protein